MGWSIIKGIGVWGDEPQDYVGNAIEKLLKRMPKRLSINDAARMKRILMADADLKARCDKVYLREWNRPMNKRELSHHIETGLSTAFCHPDVYGRNPVRPEQLSLLRLEGSENWNKQRAWAYNRGSMDARNGYRNEKTQYLLGATYDQGYQRGK